MKSINKHIFFTIYQRILSYLAENPSREFTEKEIKESLSISRAGANFALRSLVNDGLIEADKKGNTTFYSVNLDNSLIRQFKILITLIEIDAFLELLKNLSQKVILFGSAATGTNIEESDIDLFVLANEPKKVLDEIRKSPLAEKIQAIIKKPTEYVSLKQSDPIFFEEISRGLTIWERK